MPWMHFAKHLNESTCSKVNAAESKLRLRREISLRSHATSLPDDVRLLSAVLF